MTARPGSALVVALAAACASTPAPEQPSAVSPRVIEEVRAAAEAILALPAPKAAWSSLSLVVTQNAPGCGTPALKGVLRIALVPGHGACSAACGHIRCDPAVFADVANRSSDERDPAVFFSIAHEAAHALRQENAELAPGAITINLESAEKFEDVADHLALNAEVLQREAQADSTAIDWLLETVRSGRYTNGLPTGLALQATAMRMRTKLAAWSWEIPTAARLFCRLLPATGKVELRDLGGTHPYFQDRAAMITGRLHDAAEAAVGERSPPSRPGEPGSPVDEPAIKELLDASGAALAATDRQYAEQYRLVASDFRALLNLYRNGGFIPDCGAPPAPSPSTCEEVKSSWKTAPAVKASFSDASIVNNGAVLEVPEPGAIVAKSAAGLAVALPSAKRLLTIEQATSKPRSVPLPCVPTQLGAAATGWLVGCSGPPVLMRIGDNVQRFELASLQVGQNVHAPASVAVRWVGRAGRMDAVSLTTANAEGLLFAIEHAPLLVPSWAGAGTCRVARTAGAIELWSTENGQVGGRTIARDATLQTLSVSDAGLEFRAFDTDNLVLDALKDPNNEAMSPTMACGASGVGAVCVDGAGSIFRVRNGAIERSSVNIGAVGSPDDVALCEVGGAVWVLRREQGGAHLLRADKNGAAIARRLGPERADLVCSNDAAVFVIRTTDRSRIEVLLP